MMQDDPNSLLKLLQQHLTWYPLMEPRDIYKLLYQGVLGSEHLITSEQEFTRHLRSEFGRILPDQNQQLLEPVRTDKALFRLNLRAYKNRQVSIDLLFYSLLETTKLVTGSKVELHAVWSAFVQFCLQGQINKFEINAIYQFSHWLEKMEFPLVHHSEIYRREYQPAYRLISAIFLSELGLAEAS